MLSVELAALLITALAPSALAQTFSSCKDDLPSCPANPAQKNAVFNTKFGSGSQPPAGWVQSQCKGSTTYGSDGVTLTIAASGDCPGLETEDYVLFGLFEVTVKAAPGAGIVSSIVMESDALDEVDWEFIGGEDYRVQSNYFGKGDTSTYDRMVYVPVSDPQNVEHTYGVNWTSSAITWLVDGAAVRTLTYDEAQGGTRFPQTPMKLKIGIWAGGDPSNNAEGTVEWAMGNQPGSTDYSKGPFNMFLESVNIVNYSPADSYSYSDNSGTWQSINVVGGTAGGIVSPGQVAAEQSTISSSMFTATTGSAPPVQPLATGTTNGTSSGGLVTSVTANPTGSGSASASSSPAQASGNAASSNLAGGVVASGLLAVLMALFA